VVLRSQPLTVSMSRSWLFLGELLSSRAHSASPAGFIFTRTGWKCKPGPIQGGRIFDRNYAEISAGVDTAAEAFNLFLVCAEESVDGTRSSGRLVSGLPHPLQEEIESRTPTFAFSCLIEPVIRLYPRKKDHESVGVTYEDALKSLVGSKPSFSCDRRWPGERDD
jgi:hypothetical protein